MNILVIKLSPLRGVTSSMMRTIGLVKGLEQLGHQVDFLTAPASHQQIAYRAADPQFGPDVNLFVTKPNSLYSGFVSGQKSGLKRKVVSLARKIYYVFNIYDHTAMIAKSIDPAMLKKHYDLVISVSDPKSSHLAVLSLKRKGMAFGRWISYWGDPMTLDITNKSKVPLFVYRREERKMLSACDRIIYTNPFTVQAQQALFPEFAHKMDSTPTAVSQEIACVKVEGEPFRVSYIGAYHSRVRNLLPFYHAVLRLGKGVQTHIVGDSDLVLKESAHVHILPRGEVKEIERGTDLFICVLNSTGTQIPGKVYHYAASNRPILVILDGEEGERIREYLESFNRFLFCDNNAEDISRAILNARDNTKDWFPCEQMFPKRVATNFIA